MDTTTTTNETLQFMITHFEQLKLEHENLELGESTEQYEECLHFLEKLKE